MVFGHMTSDLKRSGDGQVNRWAGLTPSRVAVCRESLRVSLTESGRWALCWQKGQHVQMPAFGVYEKSQGSCEAAGGFSGHPVTSIRWEDERD